MAQRDMNLSELSAMFKGASYGGDFSVSMQKASDLYKEAIRSWTNEKLGDPAVTTILRLRRVRSELNKAKRAIERLEHAIGSAT